MSHTQLPARGQTFRGNAYVAGLRRDPELEAAMSDARDENKTILVCTGEDISGHQVAIVVTAADGNELLPDEAHEAVGRTGHPTKNLVCELIVSSDGK